VVVRYTARGTHKGEFFGIPATGKQVSVRGITIFLISGEKIKTEWTEYDRL
jgi:predicted ester cyclase